MSQPADKEHKSEIERIVDLDRLGSGGTALEIAPTDSQRAALAKRFGFLGLPVFSARVSVERRIGDQIVVEGRMRGKVVQACVLTLDPVTQDLDETFRLVFKGGLHEDRDPASGEALISAQTDAPEPLPGTDASAPRGQSAYKGFLRDLLGQPELPTGWGLYCRIVGAWPAPGDRLRPLAGPIPQSF